MKLPRKSSYLLVLAFIALAAGVVNYFLFNPHIVLFHWLGVSRAQPVSISHSAWGSFFRGHFSDTSWCTALCLVTNFLSLNKYISPRDVFVLLSLPFLSETGQFFAIVPGTFDWFDLLTYTLVITIYYSVSSLNLISVRMKKIRSHFVAAAVAVVFLLMVFASATPRYTYRAPQKLPCVRHGALNYSPVLVQINIDGSYTMKDLPTAQVSWQAYFMSKLLEANSYKYQLAQGVTPNLTINITINTDGYQHYGATVKFYVYDDNTWFSTQSNYVDPARLFDDIASRMNSYVANGWTHDCP
jgi:biopolymer transport protein ExbD